MEVGAYSHIGKIRDINEDAYYISNDKPNLFIVADGMGGHNAGEVASQAAIDSIRNYIQEHIDEHIDKDDENICCILKEAILHANRSVYLKAMHKEEYQGMGTTLTVVLILSKVYIGHVGDSRAYLIRGRDIFQITQDHSLVAELLRNGSITENEAKVHPQRNIITRALGTEEDITVDLYTLDVQQDDIIVLCTDGLSNLIEVDEMKNILLQCNTMQDGCEHLVTLANEKGGYDNITVVAIKNNN